MDSKLHIGNIDGAKYSLSYNDTKFTDGIITHEDDDAEMIALLESHNQRIRIAELKKYLADTDYVIIKIAEGVATSEEYATVIAERQSARAEIQSYETD